MSQTTQNKDTLFSPSALHWKNVLSDRMSGVLAQEIDVFETEILLKKQGKIDDKVFAETRLRRGAYGQRYDNGKRNDGKEDRAIPFPSPHLSKGPGTFFDAPGMQRIKIPFGGVNTEQMELLADVAEEYADSILHVTTRQDIQLHFVNIEDTPSLFRRLAAVGITTREACGNTVRNVTACPYAGVCRDESFDVTPYARAMAHFLLGHPDTQDFGRKFKVAFSGCETNPCALIKIHDMGLIARQRVENGKTRRGFSVYVGGGLGALPYEAVLFDEFVPEEEILPLAQSICRIFSRFGEKKKRNRARVKFLVSDWGIEKFRETVLQERASLPVDTRWTSFLSSLGLHDEKPLHGVGVSVSSDDPEFRSWLSANVKPQRQSGYSTVLIALELGDLSANQMRGLAELLRRFISDTVRFSIEQNIVLRWVSDSDLLELWQGLKELHLAEPLAETIVDVTACPGTDTCKLGISSSRGLAAELHERLAAKSFEMDEAIKGLRIKISGCFNSCGQHHVADIGFYGVGRKVGNYMVPHFQILLGGQWTENGGAYGQAVMAIPSKAVPEAVDALTGFYLKEKQTKESFQDFISRVGKAKIKEFLMPLTKVPDYAVDPNFYKDWNDIREYSKKDIGIGECAGEVVTLADFSLTAADRTLFESQLAFDNKEVELAAQKAFQAMVIAAQGLVKLHNPDIASDPQQVAIEFRKFFCDTEIFYDKFAGDKFANFFFKALTLNLDHLRRDQVRTLLEEAHLFIEAAMACNARLSMQSTSPLGVL